MTAIKWTRTEAMACAYCWCEFSKPEGRSDTPEQYWIGVSEKTRQECRKITKDRYLVAVALRQAAPLFPPNSLTDAQIDAVRDAIGLKARHRVWQTLQGIYRVFLPRDWSDEDRAEVQAALVAAGDLDAIKEEELKREFERQRERTAPCN
jgi:hypothetical protein